MVIRRRLRWVVSIILLAAAGLLTSWLLVQGKSEAPLQSLRLEARAARFNDGNPTLEVQQGAPVEITVHNAESGQVSHDFRIVGLDIRSPALRPGESTIVRFAPRRPGEFLYSCTLHPGLMDGHIRVR